MGDFAVGLRKNEQSNSEPGRPLEGSGADIRIIEDAEVSKLFSTDYDTLHAVEWLVYAGIEMRLRRPCRLEPLKMLHYRRGKRWLS